jgi:hypothetical protein
MNQSLMYALMVVAVVMSIRHWKRFSRKYKFGTILFFLVFESQEALKYFSYKYPLNATVSSLTSDFYGWVSPAILSLGILLMFIPPKKDKKNNS